MLEFFDSCVRPWMVAEFENSALLEAFFGAQFYEGVEARLDEID